MPNPQKTLLKENLTRENLTSTLISPHHLKSWQRCKKQFWYQFVEQLRWPTNTQNFELGRSVHKLLDYQSRGLENTPGFEAILNTLRPDIVQSYQLLMAHPLAQLPIVANEWGFNVPLFISDTAVWLAGRIDRIAWNEATKQLIIIDWKTGTAAPKLPAEAWQTIVYCYATYQCRKELGYPNLQPEQIVFAYVEVKNTVRVLEVAYNQLLLEQSEQHLKDNIAAILSEKGYPLPNTCPDAYCAYRTICGIDAKLETL